MHKFHVLYIPMIEMTKYKHTNILQPIFGNIVDSFLHVLVLVKRKSPYGVPLTNDIELHKIIIYNILTNRGFRKFKK